MIQYKLVKIIINLTGLAKIILNIIMRHHDFSDSIIDNKKILFTSKFQLFLYYFLKIEKKLFIAFYPYINTQIKEQNSITKVYFRVFVYEKENNRVNFLLMAKSGYTNIENASRSNIAFNCNYKYYLCIFFLKKKRIDILNHNWLINQPRSYEN